MKKLLHVVASPRGEKSRTLKVSSAFLKRFKELNPDWLVDEFNVFDESLPRLTARQVTGKYVLLGGRGRLCHGSMRIPAEIFGVGKGIDVGDAEVI